MAWHWCVHLSCGCKLSLDGRAEYDSLRVLDEFECPDHGKQTVVRMGGHN